MKITYLSTSTIPSRAANSIHVMKMCQAFAANGHSVKLIATCRENELESGVGNKFNFYGVDACFDVKCLRRFPVRLVDTFWHGMAAGFMARKASPDLVYGRCVVGCFFACLLGSPVVFEAHSPMKIGNKAGEWLFQALIRLSGFKGLVVITNVLKKHYGKKYPALQDRIIVSPDGADPGPCKNDNLELQEITGRMQIGYIGHLYKGRGVDVIMQLALRCPWADFHLVGGADEDILYWKNQCTELNNLVFHGFVSPPKAEILRNRFDILLAPYQRQVSIQGGGNSVDWMSPLKVFEYMAARKPIICSDLPVLKEILRHEHNALLCTADDVDAWEQCIIRLQNHPSLVNRLASNAYSDLMIHYTWDNRAGKILEGL